MKTLVIVESPTKAKEIKKYLSEDYTLLPSYGHIVDLAKNGKFGIGVNILNNFKPYYRIMDDKVQVLDNILNTAFSCDQIFLAMDPDLEGEGIATHIFNRLNQLNKPIKRVEFKEITKKGILSGINSPRELNDNLFKAQETRRILDRIVGFMVSPFLITFFENNLSAGRVQSVLVRMVYDREKEITEFKPQQYWNLFCDLGDGILAKYNNQLFLEETALKVFEEVKASDNLIVIDIKSKDKQENAPPPLTTATLQQLAAKKFKMSVDKTMQIAQSLFENGYTTYIRTDSVRVSDDALSTVRKWIKENNFVLPTKPNIFKNKKGNIQDAHECIRPTDVKVLPDKVYLNQEESQIYNLIWTSFIASQMSSAIWTIGEIILQLQSNPDIKFKLSGKILKEKGFLSILGVDTKDTILPNCKLQDIFSIKDVLLEEKYTQPPPRFNEASLIKELERKGIGRPSTFAETFKKVLDRKYLYKDNNIYRVSDLGKKITEILIKYFPFMHYDYTARLEAKLDDIEGGDLKSLDVLNQFFSEFKDALKQAYSDFGTDLCPKCSSPCINSKINKNKFNRCIFYPFCKNV